MVLKDRINNSNWHFIKTLIFRLHFPVIIFKEYTNKIESWTKRFIVNMPGQIARPMSIVRSHTRKAFETRMIFRARTFCLVKKKKTLDLQFFSWIGKTMKMLQWIPL